MESGAESKAARGWNIAILLVILAGVWPVSPALADRVNLDLYELTALAPLVVHGAIEEAPERLAEVRVLEVLKGEYESSRLFIAFRLINFERPYGNEKIGFEAGEEAIFCLVPLRRASGRVPHKDRFILFKGPDGKITLPLEGRQVWLDAARRLAAIAAIEDSGPLFEALRELVRSQNPILTEIGLRHVRKHGLVDESLVPVLLELVGDPAGHFGAEALDLAAHLLQKPAATGRPIAVREHLLALASAIADQGSDVSTRRAAVRLLASDGTPAAVAKLQAIANGDPSQDVRYEAAVAVYRLGGAQR
ncbi:MAG: HEAT repeat domain-containing protein [Acidobacteriota bacterium]